MALIAAYINPILQDDLRGADVNHFADNAAANGAAIKGYSPAAPDIARLVGAYHLESLGLAREFGLNTFHQRGT